MANLQNYKRVKIRMDDMISQQFFRLQNLCYVYNIGTFERPFFLQIQLEDICNFSSSAISWRFLHV